MIQAAANWPITPQQRRCAMILSAIETVKIHFVSATNDFAILVAIEGNLKVELDAWILYLRYLVLLYPCNSFHQSAIFHLDLLIP